MTAAAGEAPPGMAETIRLEGLVQGVGMRPAVWRLARALDLRGSVSNDAGGVLIRLWGEDALRDRFLAALCTGLPPLARIDRIRRLPWSPAAEPADFRIEDSVGGEVRTGVLPDAATCAQCLAEILDPADRHRGYAFTNCTQCGPRLSIVRAIPYDRANTSMAVFPLCPECRAEYEDPADRRFHAQPVACPDCGPRLWLERAGGGTTAAADPIATAADLIRQGCVVAIKGIGGFHLACDATSAAAVDLLRRRKRRDRKPFALMARDLAMVRSHGRLTAEAEVALLHPAAPIVLLEPAGSALPPEIAPGHGRLGFLLPYSPLHHLLLRALAAPIVLTSGNRSEEPQCIANAEARERLADLADALLLHDRDIINRVDDSVVQIAAGRPRLLRRARGYAPAPLLLPDGFERAAPLLAMGGELKNAFCLVQDGRAILSQHMGDLEDATTLRDYRRNLRLYADLFGHRPCAVAVDRHPDYLSTREGVSLAQQLSAPLLPVQHHHAHLAACLAEHRWPLDGPAVLGILLDGLGLGEDGELWGGEFLLGGYRDYRRLARLQPVAMPGAVRASREPWRNAYAHLAAALGWERLRRDFGDLAIVRLLESKPQALLQRLIESGASSPLASSAGRLFDAAAACLGLSAEGVSYEGQAACELQALAETDFANQMDAGYGHEIVAAAPLILGWRPLWRNLLQDLADAVAPGVIAARFHHGVAAALAATACRLAGAHRITVVALNGGVWQNRLLLEATEQRLRDAGFQVLIPEAIPANDGGLALGQAAVAAARLLDAP